MLRNLILNILTSGTHKTRRTIHNQTELFQFKLLTILSIAGLIITVTIFIIEIINKSFDQIFIYTIGMTMFFFILLMLRTLKNVVVCSTALILTFIIMLIFGVLRGGFMNSLLFFFFPLSIIVFLLTGKNQGLVWLALFLGIYGLLTLFVSLNLLQSPYSKTMLVMTLVAQVNIAVFAYIYQSKKESSENLIKQQLYSHQLTGLPNRRMLLEDLTRYQDPVLFLIDINDFKEINHVFGPNIGDQILKSLAVRIQSVIDIKDFRFYKMSADEYAILIYRNNTDYQLDQLNHIADSIVFSVTSEVFSGHSFDISVGLTIGIADSRVCGVEVILSMADLTLQTAKNSHKSFMFSSQIEDLRPRFEENQGRLLVLADALENNRLVPYFQPIIDNKNSGLIKYECLVRIVQEDNSVLPPASFLDVAKKAHLYPHITRLMIRQALVIFKDIPCEFSINLSIEDILDPFTVQFLKLSILSAPELGKKLVFEIVESEGIKSFREVLEFTREMKSLGCKFAIDDFGTGYSNFEYITRLFIDYIKIDGSLIKNLHTNYESRIIVENIVSIAKKLNIKTIAEFVHCEEVFEIVKDLGIDYSQGFFLGKPSPDLIK